MIKMGARIAVLCLTSTERYKLLASG